MTETARRHDEVTDVTDVVLQLAQDEARRFNTPYVGAEHLVLAMLADGRGAAAIAMEQSGITLDIFRERVESAVGRGSVPVTGEIELTPRTQSVVDRIEAEAETRGDTRIDSGHLLLALIRDGGGIARRLFSELGVDIEELGPRIEKLLGER
jgi:ATP-dependent Clp protease ATP-binding subunit ClpC